MDKGTPSCRISGDIIKNIEQKKYLIFCRMCLQPVERKIRSTPSRVPRASQQIIQTQGKLKEFLRQHNNIKGGLPLFFEIIYDLYDPNKIPEILKKEQAFVAYHSHEFYNSSCWKSASCHFCKT